MDDSLREKIMRWFNQDKTDPPRKSAKGHGRIEERHRDIHPRVRHQYPSANTEQERVRGHVHMRSVTPQPPRRHDRREEQRPQKQQEPGSKDMTFHTEASQDSPQKREKFTGVDFRAADVPSPVYGFRKRPDARNTASSKTKETEKQVNVKTTNRAETDLLQQPETEPDVHQHEKEASVQDDSSVKAVGEEGDGIKGEQVQPQDQYTPDSPEEEKQNKPSWVENTIRDQEEALRLIRLQRSRPNAGQSKSEVPVQENLLDVPSTTVSDGEESSGAVAQDLQADPPQSLKIEEPNPAEIDTQDRQEDSNEEEQAQTPEKTQHMSEPMTEEEPNQAGNPQNHQESSDESWEALDDTRESIRREKPSQAEITTQNHQEDSKEKWQAEETSDSMTDEEPGEKEKSSQKKEQHHGSTPAHTGTGLPDIPNQEAAVQTTENHTYGDQTYHENVTFHEPSQEVVLHQPFGDEEQEKKSIEEPSTPEATAETKAPASRIFGELPALNLLSLPAPPSDDDGDWIETQRQQLADTLAHFHVKAEVTGVTKGPAVTRFEVQPAPGVKVNKIKKLSDDLKLSLAAKDIRIEAPIPGKSTVGIEIPNPVAASVSLREMIESQAFQDESSPLAAALGQDIAGTPIITDLQKMPHGLISGATGSGKSVCINSLLISLLYKAAPSEVKMVLIDPKVVELAPFRDIPHLAAPVINEPKEAAQALKWAVEEMERRYERFAEAHARDISRYNRRMKEQGSPEESLPYIVIVIDELADLMMVSPQDVEDAICRIAQKARACGIHLVVATQRPSVDVITGLIKANIPTRIAFSVSSQADSRTILDTGGAEKLLGHGDMLFVENGAPQTVRIQGNFVSDEEIDRVTDFVREQAAPDYLFEKEALKEADTSQSEQDTLFEDAAFFVFEQGTASTSSLQRHFRVGYNRAARLIDSMEAYGMISEARGSKPRELLMTEDEFLERITKIEA